MFSNKPKQHDPLWKEGEKEKHISGMVQIFMFPLPLIFMVCLMN